jgi:hypothetical protein
LLNFKILSYEKEKQPKESIAMANQVSSKDMAVKMERGVLVVEYDFSVAEVARDALTMVESQVSVPLGLPFYAHGLQLKLFVRSGEGVDALTQRILLQLKWVFGANPCAPPYPRTADDILRPLH